MSLDTIITCFPQGWTQGDPKNSKENDSMDVLKNIHRYLSLVTRPPLESVHDLAQLIVYNCLAPFCRKSTPYGPMQILDVYESAIASVVSSPTSQKFAILTAPSDRQGNKNIQRIRHEIKSQGIERSCNKQSGRPSSPTVQYRRRNRTVERDQGYSRRASYFVCLT